MKLTFLFLVVLLSGAETLAETALSYTGRLVNADGSPVSGPVKLNVELSYLEADGSLFSTPCTKEFNGVPLTNGVFHLKLDYDATSDCGPTTTLTEVLANVPTGKSVAIKVTDITSTPKAYGHQVVHAIPYAGVANVARTLPQLGAVAGQFLSWDGSKWAPANAGSGNGSVTSITTSGGLVGGPITTTGNISIADYGVTDLKLASGISRSKLAAGNAGYFLINDGLGLVSEVSPANARSVLDVVGNADIPTCLPNEKLTKTLLPTVAIICEPDDNEDPTKLPLDGGQMAGVIDMDGHKITFLGNPSNPGDGVNKAYVDSQIDDHGTQWTTNLTHIYYNGGNVGIGDDTPDEKLDVIGNAVVSGDVTVEQKLRLKSDTANYVELKAPLGLGSTLNFILPPNNGASGNALVTDGNGTLSWGAVATTSSNVGGDISGTIGNAQIVAGVVGTTELADTSVTYAKLSLNDGDIPSAKVNGLDTALAGKEPAISASGTPLTTYWRGDKSWQTLNTTAVAEGTNLYFTEDRVLDTELAGFSAAAGTVSATDSVLRALEKLAGNQGNYVLKSGDTMTGNLLLKTGVRIEDGGAGTNYVSITAPALAANYGIVLPANAGTAGQALTTDGSGNTTWSSVATSTTAFGATGDISGSLSDAQIKTGVVGSTEITDGSITNDDIANTTITYGKLSIADGSIPVAKLVGGTAAQYLSGDKTWQTLNTAVVPESGNLYFTNARVLTAPLTGFAAGAGTVSAADNVLQAFQKIVGNHSALSTTVSGITSSQWTTSGSDIYYNSADVGIGNTNPDARLHVNSSTAGTALFRVTDGTATAVDVVNVADEGAATFQNRTNSTTAFNVKNAAGTSIVTVDTTNARLNISGAVRTNVGFSWSAASTSEPTDNVAIWVPSNNNLVFKTANVERLRIDAVGDVSIGNTKLRLKSDNSNFVELKTPGSLASTLTFILPGTTGSSGQALITNGSGVLSWSDVATTGTAFGAGGDISGSISNAQINSGVVGSAEIADGTIVNADITDNTIAYGKLNLADGSVPIAKLAGGTSAQYLRGDNSWQDFGGAVRGTLLSGYTRGSTVARVDLAITHTLLEALGILEGRMVYNEALFDNNGQWSKSGSNIYYNSGQVSIGTSSASSMLYVVNDSSAAASSIQSVATIGRSYSGGNGATGIGSRLQFNVEADDGGMRSAAGISGVLNDATAGSVKGSLIFETSSSGSLVERMRISNTGAVGIGTDAPIKRLDVYSTAQDSGIRYATNNNDGGLFLRNDNTGGVEWFIDSSGGTSLWGQGVLAFSKGVGAYPTLSLKNDKVGIGTTSPLGYLHIKSGANADDTALTSSYSLMLQRNSNTNGGNETGIGFANTTGDISATAPHAGISYERVNGAEGALHFKTMVGTGLKKRMSVYGTHVSVNGTSTQLNIGESDLAGYSGFAFGPTSSPVLASNFSVR